MSEAKPTPGPWVVKRGAGDEWHFSEGEIVLRPEGKKFDSIAVIGASAQAEADFKLFVDAGTVFHTTGLTPSQLVERVKELEGALMVAVNQNEHDMLMTGEELRAARAALSKARPNTAEGEAK